MQLLEDWVLFFDSVIQNIADSRPKVRYLIAKDDTQTTLEEIVKVPVIFCVKNFVHNLNLKRTKYIDLLKLEMSFLFFNDTF